MILSQRPSITHDKNLSYAVYHPRQNWRVIRGCGEGEACGLFLSPPSITHKNPSITHDIPSITHTSPSITHGDVR